MGVKGRCGPTHPRPHLRQAVSPSPHPPAPPCPALLTIAQCFDLSSPAPAPLQRFHPVLRAGFFTAPPTPSGRRVSISLQGPLCPFGIWPPASPGGPLPAQHLGQGRPPMHVGGRNRWMERVSHESPHPSHPPPKPQFSPPSVGRHCTRPFSPDPCVLTVHSAALPGEHSTKPGAGEMETQSQPLPRELPCRGEALLNRAPLGSA